MNKNELIKKYPNTISVKEIQKHDFKTEGLLYSSRDSIFQMELKSEVVERLIFKSNGFRTINGINVGDSFCEAMHLNSALELKYGFSEGFYLKLVDNSNGVVLNISTIGFPMEDYFMGKKPSANDDVVCEAKIYSIYLNKR